MKINCIAIDDEPLAMDVIEILSSKVPYLNFCGKIQNPLQAYDLIKNENIDLVFLDIQMPQLTGFEFFKMLPTPPMVIFTTAYPDYALESYELDAVDYLVKPIPFDRFLKAVQKAEQRFLNKPKPLKDKQEDDYIFIKTEYKTVKIFLQDILYIESLKDYVCFHLKHEKILSLLSIKSVEEKLPNSFIRVHRSFIVSIDKIDSIERNNINIGKKMIPVGENFKEAFKVMVDNKKI